MAVIAVTHSQDAVASLVLDELRGRGVSAFRFDTDRFPHERGLRRWQREGRVTVEIETESGWALVEPGAAVWWRRLRVSPPAGIDPQHAKVAYEEGRIVVFSFAGAHPGLVVDRPHQVRAAREKALQLAIAAEVGLDVLPTLVTSDPDAARAFYDEQSGEVITKMEHSFAIEQDGQQGTVHTSRVQPEDLDELDGLRLCPMIFQRAVPTVREHRATVVGPCVHTGVLDYGRGDLGTDWRLASLRDPSVAKSWRAGALPAAVEARLLALMDRLGLNYGAADFLEDAEGRFWFLEVNPSGEWGWMQAAGLPIAESMADLLTGALPAREAVMPRVGRPGRD